MSDYHKNYYKENKDKYLERNRQRKEAAAEVVRALKEVPCTDCGEEYPPYVMDFHHLDPSTKSGTITSFVRGGEINKILEEVKKCVLVCANCHREREFGSVANR